MKKQKTLNKGFTLLELLIVVLIIGILAAIALPQYQKAVKKAETRKLLVPLKAIKEAQERYFLAHSEYSESLEDLDIDLSGFTGECKLGFSELSFCRSNDNISVFYQPSSGELGIFFNAGKYRNSGFLWHNYKTNIECYDYSTNKMCIDILNCTAYYDSHSGSDHYYNCAVL